MLREWEELPRYLRTKSVRPYYDILQHKRRSLQIKRAFDVTAATVLLVLFTPLFLGVAIAIALDSKGGVFFRQVRITQYGRKFKVLKFRTMIAEANHAGPQVTAGKDARITRVGHFLRTYRLDELPQLINILLGDMTFVGTRPEVTRFVKHYTPEMRATLLLPAGVTSKASITYKDEATLLSEVEDTEDVYIQQILPQKMAYNLESMQQFSLVKELGILIRTVFALLE